MRGPDTVLTLRPNRSIESERIMRSSLTRYVVVFALGPCLTGCGHRPDYVTQFANHGQVPTSPDFKEILMKTRGPDDPYDLYRGLCRDHGFVSGQTNDDVATQRAVAAHNERYHQGRHRADVLRTLVTP
jgi:hypothetical protein